MRIVGGKYKGRVFNPDKRFTARPTTDIAKEGLFNILNNRFEFSGLKILDLFSGTGSIGYEFLSRGADEVTFVDKDHHHIRFIRKTIDMLNDINAIIIQDDIFRFIKNCPSSYDIIFADPPYEFQFTNEVPGAVFSSGLLKPDGLFILVHSKTHDFAKFQKYRELRKYGKVQFSFFQ